jgi:polyhydroxyalkanoate synthesis regulator phasin
MTFTEIGIIAAMVIVSAAFIYLASVIARYIKGASNAGNTLEQVLVIMNFFKDAIKAIVGEEWSEVYEAVRKALAAVADGHLSREEALASAKDVFNVAIGFTNVELDENAKALIYKIIEAGVNMIVSDSVNSAASVKALELSRL